MFELNAWFVKDNGKRENATEYIDGYFLKEFIIDTIMGKQIEVPYSWFRTLSDIDRSDTFLTSVKVFDNGSLQLNIYETENAYRRSKESLYEGSQGIFFNF